MRAVGLAAALRALTSVNRAIRQEGTHGGSMHMQVHCALCSGNVSVLHSPRCTCSVGDRHVRGEDLLRFIIDHEVVR